MLFTVAERRAHEHRQLNYRSLSMEIHGYALRGVHTVYGALTTPIVIDWGTPKFFNLPDYVEYGYPTWPSYNQWMIPGGNYDE